MYQKNQYETEVRERANAARSKGDVQGGMMRTGGSFKSPQPLGDHPWRVWAGNECEGMHQLRGT